MEILGLIERRQSSRVLFDPDRRIPEPHLREIREGARRAPAAHNMQTFEIVMVPDREVLAEPSRVPTETPQLSAEESNQQLSFSEQELRRRKLEILGTTFPALWWTHLRVRRDVEDFTHRNRFAERRAPSAAG